MQVLRKRHSWPPPRISREAYFEKNVDSDPFAYFISPASDRDVFTNDLSAGISTSKRSRSLSPNHHKGKTALSAITAASSPTVKLKRWIERMELRCFRRSPRASERPLPSPKSAGFGEVAVPKSPPPRGRRDLRSGSSHRAGPNPNPRRHRVWKEPSENIWPVAEEGDNVGLGIFL